MLYVLKVAKRLETCSLAERRKTRLSLSARGGLRWRRRRGLCLALAIALLGSLPGISAGSEGSEGASRQESRDFYAGTSWEQFRQRGDARKEIDSAQFDSALLAAAIFHRSNFIRDKHSRAQLSYSAPAAAAAQEHCEAMAAGKYLSHGTPNKKQNLSPRDRLKEEGLNPRFTAENIAFSFVLRYESGKPFFQRQEGERIVYSYEPGGQPLQPHTYLSFAESIVEQWMNSPHHRENLLSRQPTYLGIGAALSREKSGFDKIYCGQDFFAPMPTQPSLRRAD